MIIVVLTSYVSKSYREKFESFKPDNEKLLSLHDGSVVKGLILTKKGRGSDYSTYDFVSRYFAIWNGIPEDPVTGKDFPNKVFPIRL